MTYDRNRNLYRKAHGNTYKKHIRKPDTKIRKLIQKIFTEIIYKNMCGKLR